MPARVGRRPRRAARRADIPPGLVRWLRETADLSWKQISQLTGLTVSSAGYRYNKETADDVDATDSVAAVWVAKTHPRLLVDAVRAANRSDPPPAAPQKLVPRRVPARRPLTEKERHELVALAERARAVSGTTRPDAPSRRASEELTTRLGDLYIDGVPLGQMAAAMGVNTKSVHRRLWPNQKGRP